MRTGKLELVETTLDDVCKEETFLSHCQEIFSDKCIDLLNKGVEKLHGKPLEPLKVGYEVIR